MLQQQRLDLFIIKSLSGSAYFRSAIMLDYIRLGSKKLVFGLAATMRDEKKTPLEPPCGRDVGSKAIPRRSSWSAPRGTLERR